MNRSADSIYIVTNFTSSKQSYFPNNIVNHFWLKLSKPLILPGSGWKVSLCEIQFENVKVEDGEPLPTHYQVEFATCEGLNVDGHPTRSLRIIPYTHTGHQIFTQPYYMPLQTGYIDTCEIEINLLAGSVPTRIKQAADSLITCTLHFTRK